MRLWWRRRPKVLTHPGIRLRISVPAGAIVDADSDCLHFMARIGGYTLCNPGCLPGCDDHEWLELIQETAGDNRMRVEIKAVNLIDTGADIELPTREDV
jgi:hypothetical protein